MDLGSSTHQDLENQQVCEHVNLDEPQGEEENIMLDEVREVGERLEEDIRKSPEVGMVFGSIDETYEFYNKYAYVTGFGIRKLHTRKKNNKVYEVTIGCSKAGKAKNAQDLTAKRAKMSRRTSCKAKIIVEYHGDGLWYLKQLILEHNHNCTPSKARLYRSHKKLPLAVRKPLEFKDAAKVPPTASFQTLVERGGGYENLTYTEGDCRNYLTKMRHLKLKEGDAQAIVDYFLQKSKEDPGFFYVMDLNEDGCLRNVFWADSRSRAMYSHFKDVISFDTTYLTNKYEVPFSPFVGVNHHGSSILLGAGLLCDEKIDTYVWLFKAWLACMGDVVPQAIITDQSKAIENAVGNVFPNCRHRLCLWHILKKVPEKFSSHANYHKIKNRLHNVVYDSLGVCEFEEGWAALLKDYDLYNNEWLKTLFEVRQMWVPAFVKDTFWAGMSSTLRSEGMNAYFDKYVTSSTSLQEFFIRYEKALKGKLEKETIEDFDACDKQPTLVSRLKLEEQLSQIYTRNIFRKFQKEMQKLLDCTTSLVRKDGVIRVYEVREPVGDKIRTYEVFFNEREIEVRCGCCHFEFQGIVCAHTISVLKKECIMFIPPMYICNRWRKNFKRDYHTCSFPSVILKSHKERYENIYRHGFQWLLDMVEVAATSEEKHDSYMKLLKETRAKFNESKSRTNACHGMVLCCDDLESGEGKEVDEGDPSNAYKAGKKEKKERKKEHKKKDYPEPCSAPVASINCITLATPRQERSPCYGVGLPPIGLHQHGGLMSMTAHGDLPTQVSQIPPLATNQSHFQRIYDQPILPPQPNFISSSTTTGIFAPRAEWRKESASRD